MERGTVFLPTSQCASPTAVTEYVTNISHIHWPQYVGRVTDINHTHKHQSVGWVTDINHIHRHQSVGWVTDMNHTHWPQCGGWGTVFLPTSQCASPTAVTEYVANTSHIHWPECVGWVTDINHTHWPQCVGWVTDINHTHWPQCVGWVTDINHTHWPQCGGWGTRFVPTSPCISPAAVNESVTHTSHTHWPQSGRQWTACCFGTPGKSWWRGWRCPGRCASCPEVPQPRPPPPSPPPPPPPPHHPPGWKKAAFAGDGVRSPGLLGTSLCTKKCWLAACDEMRLSWLPMMSCFDVRPCHFRLSLGRWVSWD